MTEKEKKLYDSIKSKARQQVKRRVRNVFTEYHLKLKNYTQREQTLLGDWMTTIEMDIKKAI